MQTLSARQLKSRNLRRRLKWHLPIYLLMLPALLFFLVFHYVPMLGVVIAFKKVSPYAGIEGILAAEWAGFAYFERLFKSYYFGNLLRNTSSISLKRIFFGFPAPILLALLLNELKSQRYKRVVQTISYLPHFVSAVVLAGLTNAMLTTNGGIVNELIKAFGGRPIYFLGQPQYFQGIIVITGIWKEVGWNSIIFIAAISGIDPTLYEAAKIDGASRLRCAISVTLPSISSIIIIMLILSIGSILDAGFEQILLLYSPAVYEVGDVIDTYVYREGLVNMNYSFSTAVGLSKSVVALVLIVMANTLARRYDEQGIW